MLVLGIALVLLFDIGLAAPSSGFHERCRSFDPTYYVENSTLNVREFVAAGSNLTFPDNVASCGRASQVVSVDLCRVALEIRTSSTSRITFEMWFPEEWSGRFLATGNGGLDGCKCEITSKRRLISVNVKIRHQVRRHCLWHSEWFRYCWGK